MVEFLGRVFASGFADTMNEEHYRTYIKGKETKVQVRTWPLGHLLHSFGIKRVDFWSLDVEGAEVMALESMDWSIPVWVIVMEITAGKKDKMTRCFQILLNEGFQLFAHEGINQFWVNPQNAPKQARGPSSSETKQPRGLSTSETKRAAVRSSSIPDGR